MKKKLIVMNYSDSSINVYDVHDTGSTKVMEFTIRKLGYNLDECYYMIADELKINRFDLKKK